LSRLPSWGIEALFPVCQPHNRHYIRCEPPTLALRSGLIFSYESVVCGSAARNWTSNFASNWASNFASNWASNFASNWANDEGQGRQSCGDPVNIEHCSGQIPRVSVAVTPAPRSRQAVEKGKRKQAADEASNAIGQSQNRGLILPSRPTVKRPQKIVLCRRRTVLLTPGWPRT